MSRLIDADALIDEIKHTLWDWDSVDGIKSSTVLKQTISDINNMPTIDAVPVRHGKWKIKTINTFDMAYGTTGYEPVYQCSVCGGIEESYLRLDEPIMPEDADFPRYCPNCGASMEGEEGWIKHLEVVHFVTEAKDEDY